MIEVKVNKNLEEGEKYSCKRLVITYKNGYVEEFSHCRIYYFLYTAFGAMLTIDNYFLNTTKINMEFIDRLEIEFVDELKVS